uniref:Uncharacterized protein n=1 Tax=Trieres chinensis TaxID=1514140 RepID=A0A7S2A4K7_TRICV
MSGPPITIGWDHDPETCAVLPLDDYERDRRRREKTQLLVPRSVREEWMTDAGYARSQVQDAMRGAARDRAHRDHSCRVANSAVRRTAEEVSESARRKFKRWTGGVGRDSELYDQWRERGNAPWMGLE